MDTKNTFKYDFLIGSNNKTHKREFKKAIRTLQNLNRGQKMPTRATSGRFASSPAASV
jgi:hypothetical protein